MKLDQEQAVMVITQLILTGLKQGLTDAELDMITDEPTERWTERLIDAVSQIIPEVKYGR